MVILFLAESDTSFTRGVEDGEFSLDEDEGENSIQLLADARKSVNLPAVATSKRAAKSTETATRNAKKKKDNSGTASTMDPATSRHVQETATVRKLAVNFLNSEKWEKEVRPPHLQDDDVFDSLSLEAAAQHIMQWLTTKTMMATNEMKENKARHRGGKEKPDQEIKKVKIEAGEDDAVSILHKQRFSFRTPLQEPKEYWHLVPLRWKEVNKSIYLENVGLDNICSPRTLELLHDRTSSLEIKMFLSLNISIGRAGVSRKQNLRTLEDGTTEVKNSDDWLSPSNISQLIEALDNLVAVWVVMWPGEWSMVALRRAVSKHLAFGDINHADLRKKMLEAFINEVLANNASLAARGKPPMEFDKLDKLAVKYLDNKKHFEKSFKVEQTETFDGKSPKNERYKRQDQKPATTYQEVKALKAAVKGAKTASGKEVCYFYNTTQGCRNTNCAYEHSCCSVKNGKLCGGRHKKGEHKN